MFEDAPIIVHFWERVDIWLDCQNWLNQSASQKKNKWYALLEFHGKHGVRVVSVAHCKGRITRRDRWRGHVIHHVMTSVIRELGSCRLVCLLWTAYS